MKIAIFGYPRSGTTMLHSIITQHSVAAGAVEWWADLGEVFNPREGNKLTVHPSGHLIHEYDLVPPEVQSREDRLRIFNEHTDEDYIIKYMPFDTTNPDTMKSIIDAGYRFINIERRNPLSAYLSVIIAYHHQIWQVGNTDELPVYEPFVASEEEITGLSLSITRYYHYRDYVNPSAILYYEDVAIQSAAETLKQAGMYHEGVLASDSPTKKIHSFEDKTKLIINLEEVIDHLTGILTAYGVTMEHNDL